MAKLGCSCGNVLRNTSDAESDEYFVISKEEIEKQINENPQLLFWDFYVDRDVDVDYWYCSRCKRMMECALGPFAPVLRIFKPIRLSEEDSVVDTSLWREFYSFSENEMFVLTEKNFENDYEMTLQEFYEKYPRKYFYRISPDETKVFAYESSSGRLAFAYGKEDWTPIEPESK